MTKQQQIFEYLQGRSCTYFSAVEIHEDLGGNPKDGPAKSAMGNSCRHLELKGLLVREKINKEWHYSYDPHKIQAKKSEKPLDPKEALQYVEDCGTELVQALVKFLSSLIDQ